MGYQDNKAELCVSSCATVDEDGNEIPSLCNWVAESTYSDVCLTRGAVALYN